VSDREARQIIRSAIRGLCRNAGVEFTARPIIRSEPGGPTAPEPEPLAAITAAVSLRHEAQRAVSDHVRTAREDGLTWEQIGAALGYRPDPHTDPVSESAFRAVASDLGHGPAFTWTCPACLGVVIDYGPWAGGPADQERGHADGCGRLAETIRAYDTRWGDGDD
jgi:alkylhydroperoxidase family enzyme